MTTIAILVALGYGFGVGAYHWAPYEILQAAKQSFRDGDKTKSHETTPKQQLLDLAFRDSMIDGDQILAPIDSIEGVQRAVQAMALPVEQFWDVYSQMKIERPRFLKLDKGNTNILNIGFEVGGADYDSYAYQDPPRELSSRSSAVLILPGSGENRSWGIVQRDPATHQLEVLDLFDDSYDRFVFIKPNQCSLAIHDGKKKLNRDFYANWLIDHGGSYGANYVAQSIAITKALQRNYDHVVVAGLSQGGEAALLNALQSEPDVALIASGYSVVYETVKWSGSNQIVIPGIGPRMQTDLLRAALENQKTQYLFTWGEQERATYGLDAKEKITARALSGLANVRASTHAGGHTYPVDVIRSFLEEFPAKDSGEDGTSDRTKKGHD